MVALKTAQSPLNEGGIYILAARNGSVRALVDPEIAQAMPRLQRAISSIGHILERCLVDQDLTVSVRFEPGPTRHGP